MSPADAATRLTLMPGVGAWTAAEVAQRALGDADALSVGDYHLSNYVGHALWGRDMTDDEMLMAMAPWAGHRIAWCACSARPACVDGRGGGRACRSLTTARSERATRLGPHGTDQRQPPTLALT